MSNRQTDSNTGTGLLRDKGQECRILKLLEERGSWVSALELARLSLQYCARIFSLRKRGYVIENRLEIHDGQRRGFYRLQRPLEQAALFSPSEMRDGVWRDPEEAR
ncbi:MAG TPA: helix-turn-helix domain-containing protein [Terriglobales bacterium]|nr:helix-turn-helix domain-containing protein [Terriglobales bacterium]